MRVSRLSSRTLLGQWAATVALLAVLFQALASGAMAHTVDARGVAQVICTAGGAAPASYIDNKSEAPKPKGQAAGLPCQDCVMAASAAIAPPDACALAVQYARKAEAWRAVADTVHQHARPPPRPPSRAPPTT
jgi:hypothetical protein